MPVEDKPVLPANSIGADWNPGCWNKPRTRNPYQVKNGFKLVQIAKDKYEGVQMFKTIPSVNSLECHSDCPECVGCDHYKYGEK